MDRTGGKSRPKVFQARLFGPGVADVASFLKGMVGADGERPLCWDDGPEVVVKCVGPEVLESLSRAFGDCLYSIDGGRMHEVVANLLASGQWTVSTAESCTGGLVSQLLTSVAGSSLFFPGGMVTYSNLSKSTLLQVPAERIVASGAVSEDVARAMASGCRNVFGTDLAIAVSGIAGPSGGSPDKPVGTVCFGLASADGMRSATAMFAGGRADVRESAAIAALDMVRRWCVDRCGQGFFLDVARRDGLN